MEIRRVKLSLKLGLLETSRDRSGQKAHALALALNYQAVAVVFDLMQPVRAGRNLGSRDAGLER